MWLETGDLDVDEWGLGRDGLDWRFALAVLRLNPLVLVGN